MQNRRILLISIGIAVPAFLALAQANRVETFERTFRPHVAQGKIGLAQRGPTPRSRPFYINGVAYRAWISGDSIESSPDWEPSRPMPLGFGALEQIARQELAKLVTNDSPWSVTSFQLQSIPGLHALKWYFLVEMAPFWEPTPVETNQNHDFFCVYVDLSGKSGRIGRTQP